MCRPSIICATSVVNGRTQIARKRYPSPPAGAAGLGTVYPETDVLRIRCLKGLFQPNFTCGPSAQGGCFMAVFSVKFAKVPENTAFRDRSRFQTTESILLTHQPMRSCAHGSSRAIMRPTVVRVRAGKGEPFSPSYCVSPKKINGRQRRTMMGTTAYSQ